MVSLGITPIKPAYLSHCRELAVLQMGDRCEGISNDLTTAFIAAFSATIFLAHASSSLPGAVESSDNF